MFKLAQIGFLIGGGILTLEFIWNYPLATATVTFFGIIWVAHSIAGRSA